MTHLSSLNQNRQFSKLVLQEEEKEKPYEMPELIDGIVKQSSSQDDFKWPSGLKINRERLFRYGLYDQKGEKNSQDAAEVKQEVQPISKTRISQKIIPKASTLLIKHKVIPGAHKQKNKANKQNLSSLALAKTTPNKEQTTLNKANSVSILRQKPLPNASKEVEPVVSSHRGGSTTESKSSLVLSKFKIRTSRSKTYLSRTLRTEVSQSKLKRADESCISNESRIEKINILGTLAQITKKQESLLTEKTNLQLTVQKLQDQIQKQRQLLQQTNKANQQMAHTMGQKEKNSRYSQNEVKLSKKKTENVSFQKKNLQQTVNEMNEKNQQVFNSITEEKELIRMYQNVIEELREQLKMQKQQKIDFHKKVGVAKKNLSSLASKYQAQKDINREIFGKIYTSLEKWN